jgi:REP element-mobilizing transposase RayT
MSEIIRKSHNMSVIMYHIVCPAQIAQIIKSMTAKKIFEACPEVKKALWGGEFWTKGYYVGTVGEHGDKKVITQYVKNQRRNPEE